VIDVSAVKAMPVAMITFVVFAEKNYLVVLKLKELV